MQDGFYEQFLQSEETNLYKAVKLGEKIFAGLSFIYLIFSVTLKLSVLITISSFAVYFILYYLRKNVLYVEYEYEFTNGNITIDCIKDREKRKSVVSFEIADTVILARKGSNYVNDVPNKPEKIIKCYPSNFKGDVYVAVLKNGSINAQIEMIPNDELLSLCFRRAPRVVKIHN